MADDDPVDKPETVRGASRKARGGILSTVLGITLLAATLVFLGLAIARNWDEVAGFDWEVRPVELTASVLLLVIALASGVVVWHRVILRFESQRVPLQALFRIWFLSNLARYVPGKIWQFVGVVHLGRQAGFAPAVLLTSLAILTALTLISAAIASLLALPAVFAELGGIGAGILILGAVAGLGVVHPAVLNFGLRRIPERLHPGELSWTGSWFDGIRLLTLSLGCWVLYGLAFALFTDSLVGISLDSVPALVSANALAFLIGYLVFVTPGGLGAREAALALLLGPLGSLGVAAVIAVAFRLWLMVAEVVGAGIVALLPGNRQRSLSSETERP